jgi:hypothetical protein
VFTGFGGGDHDFSVPSARDANTHHIDLWLCKEFHDSVKYLWNSVAESEGFGPLTVSSDDGSEPDVGSRDPCKGLGVEICREARSDDAHVQGFIQGGPFDQSGGALMRSCRALMVC